MKLDRILVPTDLSKASRKAIDDALSLASPTGARVTLLHVSPTPADYLPLDEWIWGDERGEHDLGSRVHDAATKALEDFVAALPQTQRAQLELQVAVGVPSQTIVDVAASGYDLIVMTTHGRTGFEHVMLGSVAERVVRTAACPVLTTR